jgi:quaternary ammonium compound-resistance protein SugE
MTAWGWLLVAGAAEIAWSQSIRPTDGFTRPLPTLICVALAFAAIWPLARAMRDLPVGTAYAVFTGIGAIGAVAFGVAISRDPVRPAAILGIALIVAGVVTLRLTGSGT